MAEIERNTLDYTIESWIGKKRRKGERLTMSVSSSGIRVNVFSLYFKTPRVFCTGGKVEGNR